MVEGGRGPAVEPAATGLPEEAIEQREVSGCLYSWDDGTVWMSSVRVHGSVDCAKCYYARFTADVSAGEINRPGSR